MKLPEGWNSVNFLKCLEKEASNNKLKIPKQQFLETGRYPIVDQGAKYIAGYTNDSSKIYKGKLPVIVFGDHTRAFKYVDFPFAIGADGVKILVPTDDLNPRYFYFALTSLIIPSHGYSRHYKFLKEKNIIVPPIEEQEKIVAILEKAEKTKEWRKEADELTKGFFGSLLLEMFEKYLKDKSCYRKILDFCPKERNSIKAGPFGSSLKKEFYVEKGYKIYGQEQVIKDDLTFGDYYIDEERYKKLENCKVKSGDILISLVGSYGHISIVPDKHEPGIINPRLMKITLDKSKMNPVFFKYLFLSDFVKNQLKQVSHGGTMDIINVGIVKSIDFPDIPIELQNKFASIVKEVESMKEHQKQSKDQIENLFNALMQKAFKGELINGS